MSIRVISKILFFIFGGLSVALYPMNAGPMNFPLNVAQLPADQRDLFQRLVNNLPNDQVRNQFLQEVGQLNLNQGPLQALNQLNPALRAEVRRAAFQAMQQQPQQGLPAADPAQPNAVPDPIQIPENIAQLNPMLVGMVQMAMQQLPNDQARMNFLQRFAQINWQAPEVAFIQNVVNAGINFQWPNVNNELDQIGQILDDAVTEYDQAYNIQPANVDRLTLNTRELRVARSILGLFRDLDLGDDAELTRLLHQIENRAGNLNNPDVEGIALNDNGELEQVRQQFRHAWQTTLRQEAEIFNRVYQRIGELFTNNPQGEVAQLLNQFNALREQLNPDNAGEIGEFIQQMQAGNAPLIIEQGGVLAQLIDLAAGLFQQVAAGGQVPAGMEQYLQMTRDNVTADNTIAALRFLQGIERIDWDVYERDLQAFQDTIERLDDPNITLMEFSEILLGTPEQQDDSYLGRFLRQRVMLYRWEPEWAGVYQYRWDHATGNYVSEREFGYVFDITVGTYDIAKFAFFGLDLAVENTLYHSFSDYFHKQISARFDQKREKLIHEYNESLHMLEGEQRSYLIDIFRKEFSFESKITFNLIRAISFSLILHYVVNALEETYVPSHELNDAAVNFAQMCDAIEQRQDIRLEIKPIASLTEWLRAQLLGESLFNKNLKSMRGFALGMVASWYQEDSWYRKFLDGLQTVADHRLFDMSKTLFMWYRTLNVLQEHYMTTALETINKEEDKIFAYIKYVSTVPRGSKEQKDADQYIRDLLNEVQRNDFLSWVILKNTNQGNTERIVEGVLMLPVLYEVACYVVNFGKVLWSIASDS